jgi:uncharacterized protein DUF4351
LHDHLAEDGQAKLSESSGALEKAREREFADYARGFAETYEQGLDAARILLLGLLVQRFGTLSPEHPARIRLATLESLQRIATRIFDAACIEDALD